MGIDNYKFTEIDFDGQGVSDLPDRPNEAGFNSTQLKARFDNIPKVVMALGKINQFFDFLKTSDASSNIGASPVGTGTATTIQGVLEELDARQVSHKDNEDNPHKVNKLQLGLDNVDNTSDKDKPISEAVQIVLGTKIDKIDMEQVLSNSTTKFPSSKAVTDAMASGGLGDMLKVIYDPDSKNANAFNVDNHEDGVLNKVFTSEDKLKLDGIETVNSLTETVPGKALDAVQGKVLKDLLDDRTQETCIVTVSTYDSQPVVGQKITLTDLTDGDLTEAYTLKSGESGHSFKVVQNHEYKISVNGMDGYITPEQSAIFKAEAGNLRMVAMQYEKIYRYGFRRKRSESNPDTAIEYQHDAIGKNVAYMDFGTDTFVNGDWESFINDTSVPVMMNYNGMEDYELDKTDFTKKKGGGASDVSNTAYGGNAMIRFGEKYKWVLRDKDATYDYVVFSNVMYNEMYKAYAHQNELGTINNAFYWGAFKGSFSDNKLRSIAGQGVMVSQTRQTEVSRATANGAGWYTIYKSGWDYICDALTLISKSDNSQSKFGTGRCKSTNTTAISTGSLKNKGLFYGKNDETSDVKVFGIEGFWGNVWEGMAGLVLSSGVKVKMTPPYNFDGAGYYSTGITPSGTSGGFVNSAQPLTEYGYVPSVASGSATTYYCDGLWFNNSQTDYALVGGGWSYALQVGSRYVDLSGLASGTYASVGSRLSYLNPA